MTQATIYGSLGKWVRKPLKKLPRDLQKIASAYIPLWETLNPKERMARAIELDRQRGIKGQIKIDQATRRQLAAKTKPITELQTTFDWFDETLEADHWFALENVSPFQAALLLCQYNPNETTFDDAASRTNDKTGPKDLIQLRQRFEALSTVAPSTRTLSEWLNSARSMGLKYHPWIDHYAETLHLSAPNVVKHPSSVQQVCKQTEQGFDASAKPWLVPIKNDPKPVYEWYIPARYFARELVRGDCTLLQKKLLMAEKVSKMLFDVGFKKRGNTQKLSSATVLKSFSNVNLG